MKLIDTHCHLNSKEFAENIEKFIARAQKNDVQKMIVVGFDVESSLKAVELAENYECLFAAVGFHPNDISHIPEDKFAIIKNLLDHPRVIALGEIGLDYHYQNDEETKEKQIKYFKRQIALANIHQLPIIIHSRDAIKETLNALKEEKPLYGGVMHCYAGPKEMVQDFTNLGLYISLGGVVTFTNARVCKEVARETPLKFLLIETDCPYLAPNPYRGQQNEPSYIKYVAEEIARLRDLDIEDIAEWTTRNAERLFKI